MATDSLKSSKLTTKLLHWKHQSLKNGVNEGVISKALRDHLRKANASGVASSSSTVQQRPISRCTVKRVLIQLVLPILLALCCGLYYMYPEEIDELTGLDQDCLINTNEFTDELSRHLFDCDVCSDLKSVPVVHSLTQQEFEDKYAYTLRPLLVKGGTRNWTAMETFSFRYFRDLYVNTEGALAEVEENCQFFPYETEFLNLAEALNMTDERANYQENEEPWYIGWSNCHSKVAKELRSHYRKPDFLPTASVSSHLDWVFMGGPGLGASMHIDNVDRPSWQAQISGKKTWILIPSVECADVCSELAVTVEKGDILVVDTNMWYHSTEVVPGDISIAIGSEFD